MELATCGDARTPFVMELIALFSDTGGTVIATLEVKIGWATGFGTSSLALGSGTGDGGVEVNSGCTLNRSLLGSFGILNLEPKFGFVGTCAPGVCECDVTGFSCVAFAT